jgi:uncharacterized protein YbcC (UPF0753/DUF2309 family)
VAVNPFIGLIDLPFPTAMELVRRITGSTMMMEPGYYRQKFTSGEIPEQCLTRAIETWSKSYAGTQYAFSKPPTVSEMLQWINLSGDDSMADSAGKKNPRPAVQTAADAAESHSGIRWQSLIVEDIAKWCAAYYDWGQALICPMDRSRKLFSAWRSVIQTDRSAELMGLTGFRRFISELPFDALPAIENLVERMGLSDSQLTDYFHRLLMDVSGWSGHIQYQVWHKKESTTSPELAELLAIRLAYDAALAATLTRWWHGNIGGHGTEPSRIEELQQRCLLYGYLWMLAAELAYKKRTLQLLRPQFRAGHLEPHASARPVFQAVFCIDVRSEPMRRNLENACPGAQTIGFAGFFGFPIEYIGLGQNVGSALCPVLIPSPVKTHETLKGAVDHQVQSYVKNAAINGTLADAWNVFKSSAITGFTFVETIGLAFGPKLIADGVVRRSSGDGMSQHLEQSSSLAPDLNTHQPTGLSLDQQVNLAAGALKNMGMTTGFARIVMFCGHGSATTNNPYGSSLDCGACGGHRGDINARLAAGVLNKSDVRNALRTKGINIPDDTWFVAALHNTTTDEVTLLDTQTVPSTHENDLEALKKSLQAASDSTRRERSARLGLKQHVNAPDSQLKQRIQARSFDWAEMRPEWGLAGNAAFIAAPRGRTAQINLNGRVFLHDYQWSKDTDSAVLKLILSAPMVVANWINMQYFASTVDNDIFGSGSKLLHNVVGTHGVCLGNAGDLRCGLPLESVHDGSQWMHDPLRLLVIIESPQSRIDAVISLDPTVKKLIENQWVHLIAVEQTEPMFWRYRSGGEWVADELP